MCTMWHFNFWICVLTYVCITTTHQVLRKTVWRLLKNRNRTITWPSYSNSGYLPKEHKDANSTRYMHPFVHCSIIYNSQDTETTSVPTDGGRDKEDMVYIKTMEYYSANTDSDITARSSYRETQTSHPDHLTGRLSINKPHPHTRASKQFHSPSYRQTNNWTLSDTGGKLWTWDRGIKTEGKVKWETWKKKYSTGREKSKNNYD